MFQQLYNEGARIFWIHNTGPIGCLPYSIINYKSNRGNLTNFDTNGCVKSQNDTNGPLMIDRMKVGNGMKEPWPL